MTRAPLGALACASAIAILSVAGCEPRKPAPATAPNELSGRFLYTTRVDSELREMLLPGGEVVRRLRFPKYGVGSLESGLSDCGEFVVSTLKIPDNESGIYAIDLDNKAQRFLRKGWWPICGPREKLFFFAYEHGKRGSGLFVAPVSDPSRSKLLVDGAYGLPQQLVFVDDQYMATYDPSTESQVVFQFTSSGLNKVWTGGDCQPVFWRSKTKELVCEDAEGAYRTQRLMREPGKVLIDADKDVRGVLFYWPKEDVILSTTIRATWNLREYQDLIAVDLKSGKITTLQSHVDINVYGFTRVLRSKSPDTEFPDETSPSHTAK